MSTTIPPQTSMMPTTEPPEANLDLWIIPISVIVTLFTIAVILLCLKRRINPEHRPLIQANTTPPSYYP
jgi:hypothetical protein